ncbi:uncharacterized protein KY384_002700 [Bacidia gigantensis]|uniref:uncharacterized protein n=1 Tax=Bacidia gigantensis TaxID=2732470 RepID=UPI001D0448FE|nr:uncharacterized protein KY384_002700 [Bacidia gigantensis]KAG8532822.1 hypothetical protein KY384_002700 [Bacidia gigantensis]
MSATAVLFLRLDLESAPSSGDSTTQREALYLDELVEHYGPLQHSEAPTLEPKDDTHEESDTFEFRLFSKDTKYGAADASRHDSPRKIALRSPTPVRGDGGFVVARRPKSYYFIQQASEDQESQYRDATISGEGILAGLAIKWKGSELPWRVSHVTSSIRPALRSTNGGDPAGDRTKRTRKGKKSRIAARTRIAEISKRKMAEQRQKIEEEEAEKLKRMNKNREKKLKRRQKKRDTKAAISTD